MEVTQQQIDDAIVLANKTYNQIGVEFARCIRMGADTSAQEWFTLAMLDACLFILDNGFYYVDEHSITENDLWLTIQMVGTLANC